MKRKRVRVNNRLFNGARNVYRAYQVGRGIYNSYRSLSGSSSSKRKSSEMQPLTSEKDVRTVYRKRRMSRRKKRRFVKSIRRFKNLQLRTEPSRIFQYVQGYEMDSAANTCNYAGAFFGLPANDAYSNSLQKVYGQFTDGTVADQKAFASHLRIDHMSISVVLRNISTVTEGESGIIDLDVYKVMCIRDVPTALWPPGTTIQQLIQTLSARLNQARGQDIEVGDAGAGITTTTSGNVNAVGSMLWNIPTFLRYFKVLKQFKIQIGVGQVIHLNMRTSKNKRVSFEECGNFGTSGRISAKAYVTQGYIFNQNGRWNRVLDGWEDTAMEMEQYTRYNIKPLLPTADTYVYN
jgi:hypothetical protein